MGEIYSIDGITGPGRRTRLVLENVNKIGFEFPKKVIEVVTKDGNLGHYDMVPVESIEVLSDGKSFVFRLDSKDELTEQEREENDRNKASDGSTSAGSTKAGDYAGQQNSNPGGKGTVK